jgi:hypothetical protein
VSLISCGRCPRETRWSLMRCGVRNQGSCRMKFRIEDENGTSLEAALFEGRVRIITDADRLPQGHPVWLDSVQTADLICKLAGLWSEMNGG